MLKITVRIGNWYLSRQQRQSKKGERHIYGNNKGNGKSYLYLAIVSNSMPENPKAESPSTHNTLALGSYFLIIIMLMVVDGKEKTQMLKIPVRLILAIGQHLEMTFGCISSLD